MGSFNALVRLKLKDKTIKDDVARQKLKQAAQMLMMIAFPRRGTE